MATVGHLISFSVFLLAISYLASHAWPVAPGPSPQFPNAFDAKSSSQPSDGLSPTSTETPTHFIDPGSAVSAEPAVDKRLSGTLNQNNTAYYPYSSQNSGGSLTQVHSSDPNYKRQSSHSSSSSAINGFQQVDPSRQNSSERHFHGSSYLGIDKLREGSGAGPVATQSEKHKSKLDDTEESEDDDEDYDETLDSGSGHGVNNLSKHPDTDKSRAASSGLIDKSQQSDFYKPFRSPPTPPPIGSSVDIKQNYQISSGPRNHSTSTGEDSYEKTKTAKSPTFTPTGTPTPRPSTISTLVTPTSKAISLNRTRESEPDYEEDDEADDGDADETSAFEDNDTSEADSPTGNGQPARASPNMTSTLQSQVRPLNQSTKFELGPQLNLSVPSSDPYTHEILNNIQTLSPSNSLPPTVLTRPKIMTRPVSHPTHPSSVSSTSTMSASDDDDDDEDEDMDEDEDVDKEELGEDESLSGVNQPSLVSGTTTSSLDDRPVGPTSKGPAMLVQNYSSHERIRTTTSPLLDVSLSPSLNRHTPQHASSSNTNTMPPIRDNANHDQPPTQAVTSIMPTTTLANRLTAPPTTSAPSVMPVGSSTIHPLIYSNTMPSSGLTTLPPSLVPSRQGHTTGSRYPQLATTPPTTAITVVSQPKPTSNFATPDPRQRLSPAPSPPVTTSVVNIDRALRDSADDDTLTKQIYDKAVEVYYEADKTVRAAWDAVWPPNMNLDSASIEPLLTQPLFFMFALGGAIICLVLLMMLVVYIISYQIEPKDDDISIY